jgi:hypothetical protein
MRHICRFMLAILLMVVGNLAGAGPDLAGRKTCDVSKAVSKLYKNSSKNIARILYEGRNGLEFGDLQAETGLTRNKLNHELIAMRNLDLVKLVDGRYYLTWYGALLLENVDICKRALAGIEEDKLFEPFDSESDD